MADTVRRRVTHRSGGKVMTKQSEFENANINSIMNRWMQSGIAPVMTQTPKYGDFTGITDFHRAMNQVHGAEEEFMALPAAVRREADHDVGQFLEMVATQEGLEVLIGLGLPADRTPGAPDPKPPIIGGEEPPGSSPDPEPAE